MDTDRPGPRASGRDRPPPGVAALAIGVLLVLVGCSDSGGSADLSPLESAERVMELPLDRFLEEADSPSRDPRLNWTTDLCSGPAAFSPWVDEFAAACRRHDFGYRNFGASSALDATEDRRSYVDDVFAADMETICGGQDPALQASCRFDADLFYTVVRNSSFGRAAFFR